MEPEAGRIRDKGFITGVYKYGQRKTWALWKEKLQYIKWEIFKVEIH